MGDAFEPPPSAVEAVRKKLSHFFLLVDMPDADFDKMEFKARYQSVDYAVRRRKSGVLALQSSQCVGSWTRLASEGGTLLAWLA